MFLDKQKLSEFITKRPKVKEIPKDRWKNDSRRRRGNTGTK